MTENPKWRDPRFNEYMQAVGWIAASWAQLEFKINQAIWELSNVDVGAGACVTAQIVPITSRLRALISLIDYRMGSDEITKSLNNFYREIDGLSRQRNRYVHDPVMVGVETGTMYRVHITADKQLQFENRTENVNKLLLLADNIHKASCDFTDMYSKIKTYELPPWPRKQYEESVELARSQSSLKSSI
jgi:hypothetical protein